MNPNPTAGTLYDALRHVHAPPEWAIFFEVPSGTGSNLKRRADALAVNLWPSRGLEIRGFEIKVSRGDYKREVAQPGKADTFWRYCHSWWIVAPANLVQPSELPLGWGLMEPTGRGGLKQTAPAAVREDVAEPSRAFFAALARAAQVENESIRRDWIPRSSMHEELEREYQRGIHDAPDNGKRELAFLQRKLTSLKPLLAALGVDPDAPDYAPNGVHELTGKQAADALRLGRALLGEHNKGRWALQQVQTALANLHAVETALVGLYPAEPG